MMTTSDLPGSAPNAAAPPLSSWLALARSEIARYVRARRLAVMFSIDGTRRHYLLAHPERQGRIADFQHFAEFTVAAYVRVYDLLFSLGVETILTSMLYPPNFLRGEAYLKQSLQMSRFYLQEPFTGLYRNWNVRARLYGDWQTAPNAAPIRNGLDALDASLAELTPAGERLLLYGFNAGTFTEELIARASAFQTEQGRSPTESELRAACFPHGPESLHILIAAGWMRGGAIVPLILDRGVTDSYHLAHLALDVTESSLRRILYDHLFLRWQQADFDDYPPESLQEFAAYYRDHAECLVGTGHLVGGGAWYPDHAHVPHAPDATTP